MHMELMNIGLMFLGGLFGLGQSIADGGRKRISKQGSELYSVANFAVIIYGLIVLTEDPVLLALGLLGLILGAALIAYNFGAVYQVNTEDKEELFKLIHSSIKEVEYVAPVKVENEGKFDFCVPDSKKVIQFSQRDSFISNKKIFTIRFKRWLNIQAKNDILALIEEGLMKGEEYKPKKITTVLGIFFSIGLLCFSIFLASKTVMEPKYFDRGMPKELPDKLIIVERQKTISDKNIVREMHEVFSAAYIYNNNYIDLIDPIATLHYRDDEEILYITNHGHYIIIKDSYFGNKSIIHRALWWVHSLYDKDEEGYYRVSIPHEASALARDKITKIIEGIK